MSRIERLRAAMAEQPFDALLITDDHNRRYLSGFTGSAGIAVITADKALFITDARYDEQAREQCKGFDVKVYSAGTDGGLFLQEQILAAGAKTVGFEAAAVSVAQAESWKSKLKELELVPADDLVAPLRLVKDAGEIELIKQAIGITDDLFKHILRMMQPGTVEYDVSLEIEFFIRRNSAEIGFTPIVVSGARSALPHGRASEKQFERGDFVTLDFGARYEGYHSDITRTVVIGKATEEHKRIYYAVKEAQERAMDAMKPGAVAGDIDKISRDVLAKYDLAKYYGHSLGHSLGIADHDGARLGPNSPTVLEPGQVWTVEPGAYIEGYGGVRIEDDVVVTETGIEVLTTATKELLEFDA